MGLATAGSSLPPEPGQTGQTTPRKIARDSSLKDPAKKRVRYMSG